MSAKQSAHGPNANHGDVRRSFKIEPCLGESLSFNSSAAAEPCNFSSSSRVVVFFLWRQDVAKAARRRKKGESTSTLQQARTSKAKARVFRGKTTPPPTARAFWKKSLTQNRDRRRRRNGKRQGKESAGWLAGLGWPGLGSHLGTLDGTLAR